MVTAAHELLPFVDNPMNEDGWGDARAIADRAGLPRLGMVPRLKALEREGLVESKEADEILGLWAIREPRQWRLSRRGAAL